MLHIQCNRCGATLKGKEVTITPLSNYIEGVKYTDYAVACSKCGGAVVHERYAQMAAANKTKAMVKLACKKKKTIKQISEEEQYNAIMRKVAKKATVGYKTVKHKRFNKAVDELPPEEKAIVLAHEDKEDVALLKAVCEKPNAHIEPNAILLLTQSIIECAIVDKDEDFFKSEYGAHIVDMYNNALTIHKSHDYGITADLLLEKMRKGKIKVKGEEQDD